MTVNLIDSFKLHARNMAVAYQALWSALDVPDDKKVAADWTSIHCWADELKKSQAALGIELMAPASLDSHITQARREKARCEAVEAWEAPDTVQMSR